MPPCRQSRERGPIDIEVAGEPVLIDCELADARAGGQRVIAQELFTLLCRHLPASLEELQAAEQRGDYRAMRDSVHRLKGAADYCGVPRLHHDIAALEKRLCKSPDGPGESAEASSRSPEKRDLAPHQPGDRVPELEALPELATLFATMNALLETDGHLPPTTQTD